jgi:hypothetical protein
MKDRYADTSGRCTIRKLGEHRKHPASKSLCYMDDLFHIELFDWRIAERPAAIRNEKEAA